MTKLLGLSTSLALAAALLAGCSGDASSPGALSQPLAASRVNPDNQNYNGPPEMANFWVFAPAGAAPSNFEVTILGDWSTQIGTPEADPSTDAFCAVTSTCVPVVSVANNQTTISWSGTTLYQNSPNGGYHFGLAGEASGFGASGCQEIQQCEISQHWSYPSNPPIPWVLVSVEWPHPIHKHFKAWLYATVYIEVALKKRGPGLFGMWADVPYSPSGSAQPKLVFHNPGSQKLFVTNSGIMPAQTVPTNPDCLKNAYCSDDVTMLRALNFKGAPPPGYPSSRFIALTNPPKVLKPGK
jgi:hypothetical protein